MLLAKPTDDIIRKVHLSGLTDIMFDRYPGDNNTKLEPWQKFYFDPACDKAIVLPALNIMSLLSAHNTNSAPKRLRDKRKYKDLANAMLSFITIAPPNIPITRNGQRILVGKFDADRDPLSGAYVHYAVARLDKGIPNPKARPTLPLPWDLTFTLTMLNNREIKEQDVLNLLSEAGRAIGLGTFRGVYGKFSVEGWDAIDD